MGLLVEKHGGSGVRHPDRMRNALRRASGSAEAGAAAPGPEG